MTMEKTTWWSLFHLDYNGYLNKDQAKSLIGKENKLNFYLKKIESQPEKLKELQELKRLTKEERDKLNTKQNNENIKVYNKPLTNTEKNHMINNLKHNMHVNMKIGPTKNLLRKNMNLRGFKFGSTKLK